MNQRLPPPPPDIRRSASQTAVQSLGTPADFRHGGIPTAGKEGAPTGTTQDGAEESPAQAGPKKQATETLAARAGALSDEIDFPDFVAGLVHGTFDAIVQSSIRQMESYAGLVSAVAKSVEQFTEENVTSNQARDWLAQQYPQDLYLDLSGPPKVLPKPAEGEYLDEPRSPAWLADFDLEGEELTPELIEEELVPRARSHVGQGRQQMLATMVLLGLNRVTVRDGSITARLRFRAAAADKAKVEYATSDDPQSASWGSGSSTAYALPSTKVSTVGVNVQSDSSLNAELFGEVKINFASETLPLDRFADEAKRTLLERRAKTAPPPAQAARPASPVASPVTPPPAVPEISPKPASKDQA